MKKTLVGLTCILIGTFVIGKFALASGKDSSSADPILMGTWAVKIGNYSDTWTFKEGGIVTSAKQPALKGEWKQESNCVLMQWDEVEQGCKTWEAFTFPLNAQGTRGGNWNGQKVTATKQQ